MNKLIFSTLLLLLSFVPFSSKSDTLLRCDNCSNSEMRNLVFQQEISYSQIEKFYVIDYENETLRRFIMSYEFEFGYSKEIFNASIPSDVQNAVSNYFSAVNEFERNPDTQQVQQTINDYFSIYGSATSPVSSKSTDDTKQCFAVRDMYSFLTTSSVRSHVYSLNLGGTWGDVENFFNDFLARANLRVSIGTGSVAVSTSLPTFTTPIEFQDGGSLRVVRRPGVDTYDVVDGTALDCNGNLIPTNDNDITGNFVFSDVFGSDSFLDYLENLPGIEIIVIPSDYNSCLNLPAQTRCVQIGKGKFECTTRVPNCER